MMRRRPKRGTKAKYKLMKNAETVWGNQRWWSYIAAVVISVLTIYFTVLPRGYVKLLLEITMGAVLARGIMKALNQPEIFEWLTTYYIDKSNSKKETAECNDKTYKTYIDKRLTQQSYESNRQIDFTNKDNEKVIYFPEKRTRWATLIVRDIGAFATTWYWFTIILCFTVYVSFNWATEQRNVKNKYFLKGGGHEDMEGVMEILEKILAVLMPLYFIQQLDKFKKSREGYQSICGDIKSMAFYILALTNNDVKYHIKEISGRIQIDDTGILPKGFGDIENQRALNIRVERTFAKIRYILAALPQTAKHTVREKIDSEYKFDPKKVTFGSFKRVNKGCCGNRWTSYNKSDYKTEKKLIGVWYTEEESFGRTLYNEMLDIKNRTTMDYFEVLMFMLLRYINRLKEIKKDDTRLINEGLQRDIIGKWHHIYNAWGPMVTNQTFTPPGLINLLFYGGLTILAIFKPWKYLGNEYGLSYSMINIAAFALLLIVGKFIQNPFVRSGFAPSISPDAYETQEQVVRLLQQHIALDQNFMYGYNLRKNKNREFKEWMNQDGRENLERYDKCLTKRTGKQRRLSQLGKKQRRSGMYKSEDDFPVIKMDTEEELKIFGDAFRKENEGRKEEGTKDQDGDLELTPINNNNNTTRGVRRIQF